jgi:hypothetical protein
MKELTEVGKTLGAVFAIYLVIYSVSVLSILSGGEMNLHL